MQRLVRCTSAATIHDMMRQLFCVALLLFICPAAFAAERNGDVSLSAARILIEQGRDADALAMLQQLVTKAPDDFQAWFLLGAEQARARQFHDAVTSFHQVIALQPALAEPHNNLAVIYNELGDLRSAVSELEASLKLNPEYATAQENIGDMYVKLAAESYQKALVKNPNQPLRRRYEYLLHIRDANVVKQAAPQEPMADDGSRPSAAGTAAGQVAVTDQHDGEQEILQAIESWRTAWSKQDALAYFAAYDADFNQGERFLSHNDWIGYKLQAIRNKQFIDISLENIQVTRMSEDLANVVLLQHYRSDKLDSDDRKELKLRKTAKGWKIIYEQSM